MTLIETKDSAGRPNGWLLPLWNTWEHAWKPEQVYLTAVAPGAKKGPHLHKRRCGRFICVSGDVEIRIRDHEHRYWTERTGEIFGREWVVVPHGCAAEIRNPGGKEALVLNFPDRAWRPHDQDEWPVEDWRDDGAQA